MIDWLLNDILWGVGTEETVVFLRTRVGYYNGCMTLIWR